MQFWSCFFCNWEICIEDTIYSFFTERSLILIRMDRFHLSPLNTSHTYEYIDVEIPAAATKRRNSESDLLRLVGHELEIINQLIKGTKVPTEEKSDVTFSLYEQVEQGFYKCHDSIYDVPEGLRIPDLKKKPKLVSKKNVAFAKIKLQQTWQLYKNHLGNQWVIIFRLACEKIICFLHQIRRRITMHKPCILLFSCILILGKYALQIAV